MIHSKFYYKLGIFWSLSDSTRKTGKYFHVIYITLKAMRIFV